MRTAEERSGRRISQQMLNLLWLQKNEGTSMDVEYAMGRARQRRTVEGNRVQLATGRTLDVAKGMDGAEDGERR